jgi:predicted permease
VTPHDLFLRLRGLLFRRTVERDLREELEFHLEMQARKHMRSGASAGEARQRARAQFGSVDLAKEDARDVRRVRFFEELLQDVRYALRGFRRAPTFTITIVLTIALALGLNTTVFTIFDAYVLRPLAVRDPHALYEFTPVNAAGNGRWISWPQYDELARARTPFSEVLAQRFLFARMEGQPLFGELVTGNYFRMLGVGAELGRILLPEDAGAPGAAAVVVLSHAAWQSRFGGDSSIVGKRILVHGVSLQVVGVARAGFGGLEELPRDFWVPVTMLGALEAGPDLRGPAHPELLRVIGHLAPGVSVDRARAALTLWVRNTNTVPPDVRKATTVMLTSRATATSVSRSALVLLVPIALSFALVLAIACANVANMMLARGMARQREIGIRLSLGAARARLVRQLLTESVVLALPAGALGFVISSTTLDVGVRLMFATIPPEFGPYLRVLPLAPDARVFWFILVTAVAAAVFFGLAPALQATRASVVQAARGNFDTEHRPRRLRNALIVTQVTGAALLLITSGVLLRSSHRLQRIESGVRSHDVLQLDVLETARSRVLVQLGVERTVESVAAASSAPLDGSFKVVPVTGGAGRDPVAAFYSFVSSDYFSVLDIPLVSGRRFTRDEERTWSPVAIISQTTARRLWPGRDAVGRYITLGTDLLDRGNARADIPRELRVIGVARDAVSGALIFGPGRPVVYFPTSTAATGVRLLLRVRGEPERALREIDADLDRITPGAVDGIHGLEEMIAGTLYPFKAAFWVSSAIGVIALLLTLTGIYGVLSYVVTQRSREIGIRLALGASSRAVLGLVLGQSFRLAVIGLAAGSVLALGMSRLVASQLEFIDTFDALAYAGGAAIVLAACLGAALVPSRRAAHIDPVASLRQD